MFIGIPTRKVKINLATETNSSVSNSPLTDAIKKITPPCCHLFHGTKVSVLQSMIKSQDHQGALRPYGDLVNDNISVNTGEAGIQGYIVNDENIHSISTCKSDDIAVPLQYALRPTGDINNYAVLFGINIPPESERVKEKKFRDIGAFTDCTVKGEILPEQITMIMVPEQDLEEVRTMVNSTVLENIEIRTFEKFFESAAGWDDVPNSSYEKLREVAYMQNKDEHLKLKNFMWLKAPTDPLKIS